jgi:hypothetical protein
MFDPSADPTVIEPIRTGDLAHRSFIASKRPAHEEILRVLRENDPDTVTLVAVGPLTNLALASAEDPETFLRVKEVVVMGGAVNEPGNVGLPPSYDSTSVPRLRMTGHTRRRVQRIRRCIRRGARLRSRLPQPQNHHAIRHQPPPLPR